MKAFNRIFAAVIIMLAAVFVFANAVMLSRSSGDSGRPYRVEINRLVRQIENEGYESVDLSECEYVTAVSRYGDDFYNSESDNVIREIDGELYRFDYSTRESRNKYSGLVTMNIMLGIMAALMVGVLIFVRLKILKPFQRLTDVPYQLSKGNLTAPIKESKSRFFGRFIWGVDMLRENMEQQKQRELMLQKDKKTLLLSLSHDIKTPLSAIKLYSKALSKGLYSGEEKQLEIAESINAKADEIEGFVSEIIRASSEDFLQLEVKDGEFYLSQAIGSISDYYCEKLALVGTAFSVEKYGDCILKGDKERFVEVLQNIMENAVKYGNGESIELLFSEEDGCQLVTVKNSGCTLSQSELPHIFDSFWRGSNTKSKEGSGLGLYICRQLMRKMGGEVFAEIADGYMCVSAVIRKC